MIRRPAQDFIFAAMALVKNTLLALCLLTIVQSCKSKSSPTKPEDDSLQYYPPTPLQLSKEDFRHYYRAVSAYFDTMLLDKGFNGGILVAKNGEIIYEKYVGNRDIRKKDDPITDTTAMHIASTSKTFTAVAILRLVQEQKLSLDDSIQKFFPGLPYPGITVRMLLSHRSGLPNYINFADHSKNWDKKNYLTNQDMLNMLYTEKPMRSFPPGTHFSYSNTNFVLLAMIVEKITGMPFPEYMHNRFFVPLGMTHTYIFTNADSARSTASFGGNGAWWQNDFLELTYGDKNVYTTPRDLLKWDQALYSNQVIDSATQELAYTPYSNERQSIHNYGLGFRLILFPNGKKVVYHFGRWHGFNAAFARLRDEKATVIILGNKFNRNIYYAAYKCYEIFGAYGENNNAGSDDEDNDESASDAGKKSAPPPSNKKRK